MGGVLYRSFTAFFLVFSQGGRRLETRTFRGLGMRTSAFLSCENTPAPVCPLLDYVHTYEGGCARSLVRVCGSSEEDFLNHLLSAGSAGEPHT